MVWAKLKPRERITRCLIQLQRQRPYFSYVLHYFRFVESTKAPPILREYVDTIGVDKYGIVFYNPKYLLTLKEEQLSNILCHEVLHITFKHLERIGNRHPVLWNIVADMKVNETLAQHGMYIEKGVYELKGIDKETVAKSTTEALYDKLYKAAKTGKLCRDGNCKKCKRQQKALGGKGTVLCPFKSPDKHIYDSRDKKKGAKSEQEKELDKIREKQEKVNWDRVYREAFVHAKQRGDMPLGLERYLDELLQTRLPWRELLQRYLVKEIPVDYTWQRPHKRSLALGYYLPSVLKERVDVVIGIDTSGSISDKEYQIFMSEVLGILTSFQCIRGTILFCDAEIHNIVEVNEMTKYMLLNKLIKGRGYGGTDFKPVFKWIRENRPQTKILIYLTDLYGDYPRKDEVNHKTVWVTSTKDYKVPFGEIIHLD